MGKTRNLLIAIMMMFGGLLLVPGFASAQTGIPCDPSIPSDNPECPNGECRRFGASCDGLGFVCNDNPAGTTRRWRFVLNPVCDWLCRGGRGFCEDAVIPCNDDTECDTRESCLLGVCTFVASPPEPPRTRDLQCQADSDCLENEGCRNNRCTRKCTGTGTDTGCPTGEGCFNGFCAPL
jgi:hypothetical protein